MRVVVQRVTEASVTIDGETISAINEGLLLLIGITHSDSENEIDRITRKIVTLRIFDDEKGVMNRSVQDIGGSILAVSQFTLYGNCKKVNRPSYIDAAPGVVSEPLYDAFCDRLEQLLPDKIQRGRFGADMKVRLLNNGPVTILLDSNNL